MTGRRRAAVLGSPIGHSLSPVLHRAAYAALGLDWSYEAIDVDEAGLAGFLDGLDESWAGLSLTMPLKRTVIPLLHGLSPTAAAVDAVNTVLLHGDGRRIGDNTDVAGMVAALPVVPAGEVPVERVAILGAGQPPPRHWLRSHGSGSAGLRCSSVPTAGPPGFARPLIGSASSFAHGPGPMRPPRSQPTS